MFTASQVNLKRVLEQIKQLSEYGKTPDGGITRPTFGPAHQKATQSAAEWMIDAGLHVSFDKWGNLYGQTANNTQEQYILSGSHLDSVTNGGNYDGVLGVLSALEAVRMIVESGISLRKPLRVVSFIEEEGSRFYGLLGSTLATNSFTAEQIAQLTDFDGQNFSKALNSMAFPFPVDPNLDLTQQTAAFLELHIEQGKRLETAGLPLGIVSSIAGPQWWRVELTGQADHAGATEYVDRRDALLAAAQLITEIRKIGTEQFSETARMTVGKISAQPNVTNIVAGKVILDIDTRLATEAAQEDSANVINDCVRQIAEQHKLTYEITRASKVQPAVTPAGIMMAVETACQQAQINSKPLVSWAAHDAMLMARVCDAGMIFVPCRDGRSHCPDEYAKPEDIAIGIAVLANTLAELANA